MYMIQLCTNILIQKKFELLYFSDFVEQLRKYSTKRIKGIQKHF